MGDKILQLKDLTIEYETSEGPVTAVSDANVTVEESQTFGLVGESGCGKSTIAKSIMGGLDPNGSIASGEILLDGEQIHNLTGSELNETVRWKKISYIPQSSMNSLDPLKRIEDQAKSISSVHTDYSNREAMDKLKEMFEIVGLPPERISDYPHQFSGGMQQRAIIALSLFLEPDLIIADEPTTALDVIMQKYIVEYLGKIKEETGASLLIITHDISLVFEICDKMAIMHSGQICESGKTVDIFDNPKHPYSLLLQRSFPDVRYPNKELEVIEGNPPKTIGDVNYCTFIERCPWAGEECREAAPPLKKDSSGSQAACFKKDEVREEVDQ